MLKSLLNGLTFDKIKQFIHQPGENDNKHKKKWVTLFNGSYSWDGGNGGGGYLLTLLRGSRGPSTVTLMAFWYRVICGGCVQTVIVRVKLFPENSQKLTRLFSY